VPHLVFQYTQDYAKQPNSFRSLFRFPSVTPAPQAFPRTAAWHDTMSQFSFCPSRRCTKCYDFASKSISARKRTTRLSKQHGTMLTSPQLPTFFLFPTASIPEMRFCSPFLFARATRRYPLFSFFFFSSHSWAWASRYVRLALLTLSLDWLTPSSSFVCFQRRLLKEDVKSSELWKILGMGWSVREDTLFFGLLYFDSALEVLMIGGDTTAATTSHDALNFTLLR
jgi:hypothetical protein